MKNPLKKKKHKFRNFLCYFATYIAVTFSMAFLVVTLTKTTYSATPPAVAVEEEETTLSRVIGNLMDLQDGAINISLSAVSDDIALGLNGTAKLKIYSGFSNVDVNLDASLNINDNIFDIDLTYKDGYIYLILNDTNYKLHTTDFMGGLVSTLGLCGVDLGTATDLLSSFDMSMIDTIEENITETPTDNGTTLTLAITEDIKLNIDVDKDYNIVNIGLDNTTIGDFTLGAGLNFESINSGLEIAPKTTEYVDITSLSRVSEALVNTIKQNKFAFDIEVGEYNFDVKLDKTNDLKLSLNTTIFDNILQFTYTDDTAYLDYSVFKLRTTNVANLLNYVLGLIPTGDINNIDLTNIMGLINKIKLSDILVDGDNVLISVGGYTINLTIVDNLITTLSLDINDTHVVVNISTTSDFNISPSGEYIDIADFGMFVEPVKELMEVKAFSSELTIGVGDFKLVGDLKADFNDGLKLAYSTTIADHPLKLIIENDLIYLTFSDVNYVVSWDTLVKLFSGISQDFDIEFTNTFDDIIRLVDKSDNGLTLNYDKLNLSLQVEDNSFKQIILNNNDFEFTLDMSVERPVFEDIDYDSYRPFNFTYDEIKEFVSNLLSKQYSYSGEVVIGEYTLQLDINIDLTYELIADINVQYDSNLLNIRVQNNTLYIDLNGVKLSADIDDFSQVMEVINKFVTFDEFTPNISLGNIGFDKEYLTILINDIDIKLNINDFNLQQIIVGQDDFSLTLNRNEFSEITPLTAEETSAYQADVNDLVQVVDRVINVKDQQYIYGKLEINTSKGNFEIDIEYVKNKNIIKFSTSVEGVDIWGYVNDGETYINLMDVCFNVSLDDIDINELMTMLGIKESSVDDILDMLLLNLNSDNITKFITSDSGVNITYGDYNVIINAFDTLLNSVYVSTSDLKINLTLNYPNYNRIAINNNRIIRIDNLTKLIKAFYNTFKNLTLNGTIDVAFKFGEEINNVILNYDIKFDNGIKAYLNTTFKGVAVNIYIINDTIYLDIMGTKIKVAFSDIPTLFKWVNDTFNTTLPTDFKTSNFSLTDFSLDFITSVKVDENRLNATIFDNLDIIAEYDETFTSVYFKHGDINATIYCNSFKDWDFKDLNVDVYLGYSTITDKIAKIYNLAMTRQFDLTLNVDIFKNNTLDTKLNFDIATDLSNVINLYASATINNTDLMVAYQNSYLYANYDGLKLAINQNNLKEILGIVLQAVGLDSSMLGIVDDNMKLDTSNLQAIIPQVDMGNPLNMLSYLSGLEVTDNTISIVIKESIFDLKSSDSFKLTIEFDEVGITKLFIDNLHANKNTVDAELIFNKYEGVPVVEDTGTYIDISNASDLIRAFVNTSALNDFFVTGQVSVSGTIFGTELINKEVNLDVHVQLVDNKPIVSVAITEIPVIDLVNKDIPALAITDNNRALYIYYKDGYFYLYRHETYFYWGDVTYEKKLKISDKELFSDPLGYLLKWGLGFGDMIMDEIYKSVEISSNRSEPINMSNVLMGYKQQSNGDHTLTINMGEIAYNDMLGYADINLSTTTKDDLKYLYQMKFNMNMPLTDNINIDLATDNLTLTNIGQPVDMTKVVNYINSYPYLPNQQYEAENGEWEKSSEVKYTLSFDCNGSSESVSSITGYEGQEITVPVLKDYTIDVWGDKKTDYHFVGWYYDKEYENAFEGNTIPRGDATLYAKWDVTITYYYTLTFNSVGGKELSSITALERSEIDIPILTLKQVQVDSRTTATYTFVDWYYDSEYTQLYSGNLMPDFNATLYAKWSEPTYEFTRALNIVDNGEVKGTIYLKAGTPVISDSLSVVNFGDIDAIKDTTKYYTDLTQDALTSFTMPDNDTNLYIRNYYYVRIYSEYYNRISIEGYYLQDTKFEIPTQQSFSEDDGTETLRREYTFNGYVFNGSYVDVSGTQYLPNYDCTIIADWSVYDRYYYTITFDTKTTGLSNTADKGVTTYSSVRWLEGISFSLADYNPTCSYKWGIWYKCDFKYWEINGEEVNGSFVMPKNDVTVSAKWGTPYGDNDKNWPW